MSRRFWPEKWKVELSDARDLTSIESISMMYLLKRFYAIEKRLVNRPKDFITVRLDERLKDELLKAADLERRSLSNFCRLLLEYSWGPVPQGGFVALFAVAYP